MTIAASRWRAFGLEPDSPEWLTHHKQDHSDPHITASAVASVLGVGYQSPKALFQSYFLNTAVLTANGDLVESREIKETKETKETYPMIRGKRLEETALSQFRQGLAKKTGDRLVGIYRPGLLYHPQKYWLGATSDGLVFFTDGLIENLEIKIPMKLDRQKGPELKYLIQVQFQMAIHKLLTSYLYIWAGKYHYVCYKVQFSPEFFEWASSKVSIFMNGIMTQKFPDSLNNIKAETMNMMQTLIKFEVFDL